MDYQFGNELYSHGAESKITEFKSVRGSNRDYFPCTGIPLSVCVCVCVCARARACVRTCVCVRSNLCGVVTGTTSLVQGYL